MPENSLATRASAWRDADPDPQTLAELDQLLASGNTAGLARYITTSDPAAARAGVVVGYDGALDYTVRHRHAAYSFMVTASHNPRQYNGIKLYVRLDAYAVGMAGSTPRGPNSPRRLTSATNPRPSAR